MADYNGALINVSIQGVDPKAGTVSLYAPVFKDRTYRLAKPMPDYVQGFKSVTAGPTQDRKSTRLNSSHSQISYAVFCLKKKKPDPHTHQHAATEWGAAAISRVLSSRTGIQPT